MNSRLSCHPNLAQRAPRGRFLISPVVDRERLGVAESRDVLPQDLHALRVERRNLGSLFEFFPNERTDTLLHFASGLVRERHRQDSPRIDSMPDELGHAVGDDPRLARSGSCQNQQWPLQGQYRFPLRWIQILQTFRHRQKAAARGKSVGETWQKPPL